MWSSSLKEIGIVSGEDNYSESSKIKEFFFLQICKIHNGDLRIKIMHGNNH